MEINLDIKCMAWSLDLLTDPRLTPPTSVFRFEMEYSHLHWSVSNEISKLEMGTSGYPVNFMHFIVLLWKEIGKHRLESQYSHIYLHSVRLHMHHFQTLEFSFPLNFSSKLHTHTHIPHNNGLNLTSGIQRSVDIVVLKVTTEFFQT